MKEVVFLNKNKERWWEFENDLKNQNAIDPDKLATLFIQLTDDLAYSKTYFPNSNTSNYLNSLAISVYLLIYKNKKESTNQFARFWKIDLPLTLKKARKNIFLSLFIFLLATAIGVLSMEKSPNFAKIILGKNYVEMTKANIKKGEPMAVYSSMEESYMSLAIAQNNIMVSFWALVLGITLTFGTIYVLLSNGIMLGCFQYFFIKQGIVWPTVLTIWIHGTLEIWAIIVSGACGLMIGKSIVFPGTYSRLISLKNATLDAIKIIMGLMPVFILAAFLEGFVTRHTEYPYGLRASIILISVFFIVWYFFLYPNRVYRKMFNKKEYDKTSN